MRVLRAAALRDTTYRALRVYQIVHSSEQRNIRPRPLHLRPRRFE